MTPRDEYISPPYPFHILFFVNKLDDNLIDVSTKHNKIKFEFKVLYYLQENLIIMATDCIICCEEFNKSNKKKVKCMECDNICCRECHQTYLLSKDAIDCMFCYKPQTYEHIKNSHYDTFIKSTGKWKGKGYKEHIEGVYYKNEMAMFPETLHIIEVHKKRDKHIKDLNNEYEIIISKINSIRKISKLSNKERLKNCDCKKGIVKCKCISEKDRDKFIKEKDYNDTKLIKLEKRISSIYASIMTYTRSNSEIGTNIKKKTNIEKCMATDCDGFLTNDWKCNKCHKITCERCREIKDDNHKCDENTVKTIQFAIKTSKPCPKCNERIHRIYGCDQVYCPLCKIVFSYSTGIQQIGGVIHQPDAVNELRKTGRLYRDIRDIPCGGIQYIINSINDINNDDFKIKQYPGISNIMNAILRWCIGYEDLQLRGIIRDNNILNINSDERYWYLSGEIDKSKFKKLIYNNYRKYDKINEETMIKAGFYVCVTDILRSLKDIKDYSQMYDIISQIFILSNNYNNEFIRVNKLYSDYKYNLQKIFIDINIDNKNKNHQLYFGIQPINYISHRNTKDNLDLEKILNYYKH